MIRILYLVFIISASSTLGLYAQSAPGIIVEEEPKCFICGRVPTDFAHVHDGVLRSFDARIHELSSRIADIERESAVRYRRVAEATRDNPNMKLTVETVKTDVETFSKLIPYVEEILTFYDEYGRRIGLGSSLRLKLSDIVDAMENPPLPELLRVKRELKTVEAQRNAYEELSNDFLEFPLFRVTTKFSTISADLANIEDLKTQNNKRLSRMLSEARAIFKDPNSTVSLSDIIDQFRERIYADPSVREEDRDGLYYSFVADFLQLDDIEYTFYLCPICLTLLKNGAPSSKYRVLRFNRNTNRWDTTMHDFP